MDCLDPPMQETPEGKWYCPLCPTLPPVHESESVPPLDLEPAPEPELPIDPALQMDIDPALREASVASSSHHSIQPEQPSLPKSRARGRRDRKGKGRAVLSEDEEDNQNIDVEAEGEVEPEVATLEEDMEEEVTFRTPASRRKSTNNRKRGKGRPRRRSESVPDDGESPGPPLRPPKRIRLVARPTTPEPTPRPRKTVRLRFSNQKGKGKARDEDEDEEAKKGMFDDILNVEDRDTMKTTIVSGDKERFDKARNGADVCTQFIIHMLIFDAAMLLNCSRSSPFCCRRTPVILGQDLPDHLPSPAASLSDLLCISYNAFKHNLNSHLPTPNLLRHRLRDLLINLIPTSCASGPSALVRTTFRRGMTPPSPKNSQIFRTDVCGYANFA